MREVYRVLKPRGTFISISHGDESRRLLPFQNIDFDWEIRVDKVMKLRQVNSEEDEDSQRMADPEVHYIYTCVKVSNNFLLKERNR